jgi:hypothetical protein
MDRAPTTEARCRIGVLWPGDPRAVVQITPEGCRLHRVFDALRDAGAAPEPVVYADEVADEIRDRLRALDGVLVWVNPIENGRDRSVLDALLRDAVAAGGSTRAWRSFAGRWRNSWRADRSACSSSTGATAATACGRCALYRQIG